MKPIQRDIYKDVFHDNFFTAFYILSFNAVINIINTVRNIGKTFIFRFRAIRRFQKHHKKTIWLRFFKEEAKETARKFLTAGGLAKIKKFNENDVCVKGRTVYARYKGGKLEPCIYIIYLSEFQNLRSADDVDTDEIIFDEYNEPLSRIKMYHGNPAENFFDLCFSIMRTHKLRVFLLGNNETTLNPFTQYLNIQTPPNTFEGVKTYKNGSIAYQSVITPTKDAKEAYADKWADALEGTPYIEYLTHNTLKGANFVKGKPPKKSNIYIQTDILAPLAFLVSYGRFYAVKTVDKFKYMYVDKNKGYKREILLKPSDKRTLTALATAVKYNLISYEDESAFERAQTVFAYLNI